MEGLKFKRGRLFLSEDYGKEVLKALNNVNYSASSLTLFDNQVKVTGIPVEKFPELFMFLEEYLDNNKLDPKSEENLSNIVSSILKIYPNVRINHG